MIADRDKPSSVKEIFDNMDSKTHLDGDDHREFSNFDYLSPVAEENSYPNDIFAKNIDVFSGPKISFQLRNMQMVPINPTYTCSKSAHRVLMD